MYHGYEELYKFSIFFTLLNSLSYSKSALIILVDDTYLIPYLIVMGDQSKKNFTLG